MCNKPISPNILECFPKRRAREDGLFNARTNMVLVVNGLAAIAATSAMSQGGISPVLFVVIAIVVINGLWTLYAPGPAMYIHFLGESLDSTPDELLRKDVADAREWRLLKRDPLRIRPTWLMARVIPPLLLGTWVAAAMGSIISKFLCTGWTSIILMFLCAGWIRGLIALVLGPVIGATVAVVFVYLARPPKRSLCNICYRLFESDSTTKHECNRCRNTPGRTLIHNMP